MPWYDYRCEACDRSFEARMPIERRDEAACPACGSTRVKRAMPSVVTVLAGVGARSEQATAEPSCAAGEDCCGGLGDGCGCAADDDDL